MNAREKLIRQFKMGYIEQVLNGVLNVSQHYEDHQRANEIIFHISRFKTLSENKRKNLLGQADYQLEYDRIRQATFEIIDTIPEYWDAQHIPHAAMSYNKPPHLYPLLFVAIFFLVLATLTYKNCSNSDTGTQQTPDDSNLTVIKNDTAHIPKPKPPDPNPSQNQFQLRARILDEETNLGLEGVIIYINGTKVISKEGGYFEYAIPASQSHNTSDALQVSFEKDGYMPIMELIYIPGSTDKPFYLSKIHKK
ncbi:MAG: hypothetical protein ACKV1O_20360 [Saprospiraceae bacterium]